MVRIQVRTNEDLKKIERAIIDTVNEVKLTLFKRARKASLRITKFIVRSLRARLAGAPYSSHSSRPGPWSRNGGRPSEQSIRMKATKRTFVVYVEDNGTVRGRGVLKPSQYIHIRKGERNAPASYVDEAVNAALNQLNRLLKQIWGE